MIPYRRSLTIIASAAMMTMSAAAQAQTQQPAAPAATTSAPPPRAQIFPTPAPRPDSLLIYATASPLDSTDQYVAVTGFARCAARVSPELAARLLAADPRSARAAGLSRQLRGISKGCAPAGAFVPTTFFRSAVAEALYLRSNGATPAAGPGPRPVAAASVADCVFAQSPRRVDELLRTRPGTGEERAAFGPIALLARKCIVAGQRVDIAGNESFLRSGLAETAYRSVDPTSPLPTS